MVATATHFIVRPMKTDDIDQVLEVERDAFPTLWPPTPFKREMRNKLARYLVAVDEERAPPSSNTASEGVGRGLFGWVRKLRRLLMYANREISYRGVDFVVGYLGIWSMVDDAHIVAVGVRGPYRRLGVGELMMIRSIEIAKAWGSRSITLEVRVSNFAAQALYEKYGFKKVGVRKRYYTDNQEDAYVMTTDPIGTEEYRSLFERLKESHFRRLAMHLDPEGEVRGTPSLPGTF